MKRKLIRFGKSAFCITLPIDWVRKNSLEKGHDLQVEETLHNSLEVIPSNTNKRDLTRKIEIDLSGLTPDEANYMLRAAYINGYFIIKFVGVDESIIKSFRDNIDELIAAEIMAADSGEIEIHIFWDIKNINLQTIMQRIEFLVKNIFSETVTVLESASPDFSSIEENSRSLARQVLLARRATTYALLNAQTAHQFKFTAVELHYLSSMTEYLGNIGEYLADFAHITAESEGLTDDEQNEIASLVRTAEHYLRRLLDAYREDKGVPFVMGSFMDFKRTIDDLRSTYEESWTTPVLSEYLRLIFSRIRETEFVMISMKNAPR